ncbi:MAG: T9SS type A sorting domain-containing protein, partial [Bacteroidetes bacterium]|nr:T9SS type A sorting domain-containing protein [Bacteroidota bacterium]
HADYHAFIFHPTNTDLYYACNDGGIFEYSVSTNRYIDRNYGFNATQYFAGGFAPDSFGVVGGTQDNGTHYQAYGNKNLDHVWGGDGAFCHINQQNPDLVYVSSQNGVLGKNTSATTNPGGFNYGVYYALSSAGAIDDGVWFVNPFEMNYLNGDDLYFVSKRRVWYSTDAGEYWAPLTNYKANFYSIGIPNEKYPSMIYAGGQSLLLYRIDDPINAQPGDEVSLRVNTPSGMTEGFIANIKVHPRINGIIYLAMSNYSKSNEPRVWKVEDADTDNPTWVDISGDLPKNLPCNWVEIDPYRPDSVFYAATDFGLYTTTNGGKNWIKESRLPNVIVSQIRMRNDDRRLFIYTHGRGIWFADLQKVEDYYASTERAVNEEFSVYPNPTTDVLSLNYESLVGKPYSIISIANGQEVAKGTVINGINVSQLAVGNYVLRITEEGKLRTAKFVKE